MLGALGILFPEILEKYAGIEFGVSIAPMSSVTKLGLLTGWQRKVLC